MQYRLTCASILGAVFFIAPGCSPKPQPQVSATQTQDGRLAPRFENLGDLHMAVSTQSLEAQVYFDQGLTLVYAFNHAEALRSFQESARLDGSLAMAYWGQAIALAPNINDSAIGPDREKEGRDAIDKALERQQHATPKEQALIQALATRFSTDPPEDRTPLNTAYAAAMKKVYEKYPTDPDIGTLYADAVMNTMPWDYWRSGKPKPGILNARRALEAALAVAPSHPGAHHAFIHLVEASPFVDDAVPSAEKLGGLVPAAGHLVHMPSHIFIRVGRYAEAAEANVRAVKADEDYITQCRAQGMYPAALYPHNIHFLSAALAMSGQSQAALAAAAKVATRHTDEQACQPGFGFAHLMRTMPAMMYVRFGKWDEILSLPAPPNNQVYVKAMWHFARGYAFTAQRRLDDARTELTLLEQAAAHESLLQRKIFDVNSLQELAAIGVAMLEGELAASHEHWPAAIRAYRRAVQLEDALLYSEPPDWMLPPRQYLGAVLLAAGQPREAERVYRDDLKRHRNNGWSLAGLALALERQNKSKEARETSNLFTDVWRHADFPLSASRL